MEHKKWDGFVCSASSAVLAQKTVPRVFSGLSIAPKLFFDPLFIIIHGFIGTPKHQINGPVIRRQFRHADRGGILFPRLRLIVLQTVFIPLFQRFNKGEAVIKVRALQDRHKLIAADSVHGGMLENLTNQVTASDDMLQNEAEAVSLGFAMTAAKQHMGYGVETISAIVKMLREIGVQEIRIKTWKKNLPCQRLAEKLGFERVSVIRNGHKDPLTGETGNSYLYSLK